MGTDARTQARRAAVLLEKQRHGRACVCTLSAHWGAQMCLCTRAVTLPAPRRLAYDMPSHRTTRQMRRRAGFPQYVACRPEPLYAAV